jgi:hypothetical protein
MAELRHVFCETRLLFCSLFGRGLDCGCDCGVVGVREGSGDVVLVPADALVYDRVFEAVGSIDAEKRLRLKVYRKPRWVGLRADRTNSIFS